MIVDMRSAPASVSVRDLHDTVSPADACTNWQGFFLLHSSKMSRTPLPFMATRDMESAERLHGLYQQVSPAHPLGCRLITEALVTGPSYAFSQNQLLQVEQMLDFFLEVRPAQVLRYNMERETLPRWKLCLPTSGDSGTGYFFHGSVREFHGRHRRSSLLRRNRRICISRHNLEQQTCGVLKRFRDRECLEVQARALGFEIVCPEEHSILARYDLFVDAGAIVGEFGSGLHNSLFAAPGVVVGSRGCINSIQHRVVALMSQNILYAIPESVLV